jgi:hypothetical protein
METSEYESLEAMEAESESESESESEAAERRRQWKPPQRASGAGLYRPRPRMNGAPVSQLQLQAAMARVGDQLKKNSAAVSTVNSRVNTVSSAEKRDNEKQGKDLKSINEKIQLLTLLPLLIQPSKVTVPAKSIDGTNPANPVPLTPDPVGTTNALLPLLLIGGLGGGGGLGSGSGTEGSMDSTTLLVLALVLSGGVK